jgi:hypothetical protein
MGGALGKAQDTGTGHVPVVVGPNYISDSATEIILLATPEVDTKGWRIAGTLPPETEEREVNRVIQAFNASGINPKEKIVYYGLNAVDKSPDQQVAKLASHGIAGSVYRGGMFEWLLLREVFGADAYAVSPVSSSGGASPLPPVNPLDYLPRS